MRLQGPSGFIRDIAERGSTTLLRQVLQDSRGTGSSGTGATASPAAGRRWLVTHLGISAVGTGGAFGAADVATLSVEMTGFATPRVLIGLTLLPTIFNGQRYRHAVDCNIIFEPGDPLAAAIDATGIVTAARTINLDAIVFGYDFVPI